MGMVLRLWSSCTSLDLPGTHHHVGSYCLSRPSICTPSTVVHTQYCGVLRALVTHLESGQPPLRQDIWTSQVSETCCQEHAGQGQVPTYHMVFAVDRSTGHRLSNTGVKLDDGTHAHAPHLSVPYLTSFLPLKPGLWPRNISSQAPVFLEVPILAREAEHRRACSMIPVSQLIGSRTNTAPGPGLAQEQGMMRPRGPLAHHHSFLFGSARFTLRPHTSAPRQDSASRDSAAPRGGKDCYAVALRAMRQVLESGCHSRLDSWVARCPFLVSTLQ